MATLNVRAAGSFAATTTETLAVTLAAGTNRKAILFCALESAAVTIDSAMFDAGGADEAAMTAPGGNGSPARVSSSLAKLFVYDIPDAVEAGSKTFSVTMSDGVPPSTGAIFVEIIDDAATGALEDIQTDSDPNTSTTISATLTNASTSYVGAAFINGAAGTTHDWTSGDLTEWDERVVVSGVMGAGDATATANATATVVGSGTANNKVLIAWAASTAASSALPLVNAMMLT